MPARPSPAASLSVALLAESRETLDGLQAYLQAAGVASHAARSLHDVGPLAAAAAAVILFPDEFEARAIIEKIADLRAARPPLLLVVVTSDAARLLDALDADGPPPAPVVLPKPAFGWTILDAIREHARSEPGR